MKRDVTFTSGGARCAAWHLPARSDALASSAGRPCVVMAHGFAGTRDSGLLNYAEPFADAGFDVFVFDYRGFGDSGGTPRQDVSVRRQRKDYHAALAAARRQPGVDPQRIALWGVSYAGGHALVVAAQDGHVAAVVSLTPVTDGLASLAHIARGVGVGRLLRLAGHGMRDAARALTGRTPHHVPVIAEPGPLAVMSLPNALEIGASFVGPTFRNEVCARAALKVGLNRPITFVSRLACPVLVQVGAHDRIAPPGAARRAAKKAKAQLSEYPVDHLDVYAGPWQRRALADQLRFLVRAFTPAQP
ncbi:MULTISPECIES: alpha/beta hydrolase [unclassified Streptomyces]|uniref:alpha/beta hydrolase n=1 Tax=unclassified Streptomyces TaxID=2593676 RepID=UPI0001D05CD1|nr:MULTISPECIES: alpha/beta hydrolase [unclassified Streptomyces]EFF88729.1 alpha/beta hydrolase [Streptomyces sp. e14]NED37791.1 acetylxylan esterase [Streptomyces sp. SID8499]NED73847.1 acetylxylan esterase [Streptomyces sp. SID9944]